MISLKDRTGYFKITTPLDNFSIFRLIYGDGEYIFGKPPESNDYVFYFNFNNEEEAYYHFDGCIVQELTSEEVNQLKAELL